MCIRDRYIYFTLPRSQAAAWWGRAASIIQSWPDSMLPHRPIYCIICGVRLCTHFLHILSFQVCLFWLYLNLTLHLLDCCHSIVFIVDLMYLTIFIVGCIAHFFVISYYMTRMKLYKVMAIPVNTETRAE